MTKYILPLLLSLSLTACVPAAFVAGAGAGALMYNKRSVTTMMTDNDASNAVLKGIEKNRELWENTHIVVSTMNQIMLIAGQANTEGYRQQVYQIASQVPNLRRIYNEITIEPPSTLSMQSKDTWITSKVKTALFAEKGLQSHDIKVVTENRIVYLMGMVTPKQADLAANAASQVSDVKRVVKIFEYQQ
jgi:osmotically-inducible protein OsmY